MFDSDSPLRLFISIPLYISLSPAVPVLFHIQISGALLGFSHPFFNRMNGVSLEKKSINFFPHYARAAPVFSCQCFEMLLIGICFVPFAVPPDRISIKDESGNDRISVVGPYNEGDISNLYCEVFGGKYEKYILSICHFLYYSFRQLRPFRPGAFGERSVRSN